MNLLFGRKRHLVDFAKLSSKIGGDIFDNLFGEDIFGFEVVVEISDTHAECFGDIGNSSAVKSLFGEEFERRMHNRFALECFFIRSLHPVSLEIEVFYSFGA